MRSSRYFPPLLALLLGSIPQAARSDFTLVYADLEPPAEGERGEPRPVSAQRIYVRENGLAVDTYGESKVTLFDRDAGTVRMIDHDSKIYIDMDTEMVTQLSERLSETERKVLDGFEEKISNAPKQEKKRLREILDDIHAAHNYQLSKPPALDYRPVEDRETVGEFEAEAVDAFINKKHRARYYLVDFRKLGMTRGEYETLVEFQDFMKRLARHTPGALQRNFGDLVMLAKAEKVPVMVERIDSEGRESIQQLLQHHDRAIDDEWFRIPEGFTPAQLRPRKPRPGDRPPAPAAAPEKA